MAEESHETLLRFLSRKRRIEPYALFLPLFEQTARRLGEQAGDHRLCQETISSRQWTRWLQGQAAPQPYGRAVLEEIFGHPVAHLLAPQSEQRQKEERPLSAAQYPHILEEDLLMTAHAAGMHAGDAASSSLTPESIDLLRSQVSTLARAYHQKPASEIFVKARRVRETIEQRMPLTHRPDQTTDLLLLAGQSCALLASAAFDLGSREAAEALTRAAIAYARPIDHTPLIAWCGGNLALLAYWDGRPTEALGHVEAVRDLATSGTAKLRLHSIAARTYGHLGDSGGVRAELAAADQVDMSIRDDHHDEIGGEFGFSPERAAMSAGSSWLLVQDGAKAVEASTRALALARGRSGPQRSPKVEMEASADLALAQLLSRDFESAVTALGPVFDLPPEKRVDGLLSRLRGVRSQLAAPELRGRREAAELARHIEGFGRDSARSMLPGAPSTAIGG
ncbi:DNA-binding protein [Streptomyces termitum]|uniref:Uncharacterized protein n=1 Tax=Streptomyces termitum TaxID=67368 RepID=A0A918T730_9ACTN|nr:DNA-binding protein [Streptomyces termitum]GHA93276.1 hypothetical protein GCM10010305_41280 [Streptomyces termitum]